MEANLSPVPKKKIGSRVNLGLKFVLVVVVILFSTRVVIIFFELKDHREQLISHIHEKGQILGRLTSIISHKPILSYDFTTLNDYVKEITKQNDIVFCIFVDNNNKPISSYIPKEAPYTLQAFQNTGISNIAGLVQLLNADKNIARMDFPIVFDGKKLGDFILWISEERLQQQMRHEYLMEIAGNLAVIIFLSFSIYMTFLYYVLRPVKSLVAGYVRVGEGNLNEPVKVISKDEIGSLTQSFNKMILQLKVTLNAKDDALSQLKDLNLNLEEKVDRRTEELSRSEERIRKIFENIGEGILTLSTNGLIQTINPAAERIFKLSSGNTIGSNFNQLLVGDNFISLFKMKDNFNFSFNSLAKKSDSVFSPMEILGKRSDGTIFPMETVATEMTVGSTPLYICIVRDITYRKDIEKKLADAQNKLIESAHRAGMAEIATGALHNLGNVLNSVNISIEELSTMANESRLNGLHMANDMLNENIDNLPVFFAAGSKGEKLVQYYLALGKTLNKENEIIINEISFLNEKISIMKDIITHQQSYARSDIFFESVDVEQLVRETLLLQSSAIDKAGIKIDYQFGKIDNCLVQKSKLIQVITNIVNNAGDAMEQNDYENIEKLLVIETSQPDRDHVMVTFKDNGCGISHDDLTKIFTHGFTTKKTGSGFGLHISANAMSEMGGSLKAHSEGDGKGAIFTLELEVDGLDIAKMN